MAERLAVGQFQGLLECSICLEQYDDPKMLKCTHEFCKHCLEGIITFRRDGSAAITCPLRCDKQTIIRKNQTVNDLTASYNFKNILEALEIEEKPLDLQMPVCTYDGNCKKYISVFCCGNIMCNTCYMDHVETEGDQRDHRKVNLSLNKRENKVMVLCDDHGSLCPYLCTDNKFLCMYCMHRDRHHKQHSKNTIEVEVSLLKEALGNELNEKEKMEQFQTISQQNILIAKEKFENLLQQQKEECLSRYSDLLNGEEERLKKKFQTICENHMKEYGCTLSSKYYRVMLGKRDVELVLQKDEILDAIRNNKNKLVLKTEVISLSESFNFLGGQPLGDIHVVAGEDVSVKDPPQPTLKHNLETKSKTSTDNCMFTLRMQSTSDVKKVAVDAEHSLPACGDKNEDVVRNDSVVRNAPAFKSRGNEYFKQGMYDEAIDCYTKAIEYCPRENIADLSMYYQNRAAANEKLKQWREVVKDCTGAIELNPKYCKALHRRARAYEVLGKKKKFVSS